MTCDSINAHVGQEELTIFHAYREDIPSMRCQHLTPRLWREIAIAESKFQAQHANI